MPRPTSSLRKLESELRQACRSVVYFDDNSMRRRRLGGRIEYRSRKTSETIRVNLICSTGAIMVQ
jgi:hypothetical protein